MESTVFHHFYKSFTMLGQDLPHERPKEHPCRVSFMALTTAFMTRIVTLLCGGHLFSFYLLAQVLKLGKEMKGTPNVLVCSPAFLPLSNLLFRHQGRCHFPREVFTVLALRLACCAFPLYTSGHNLFYVYTLFI